MQVLWRPDLSDADLPVANDRLVVLALDGVEVNDLWEGDEGVLACGDVGAVVLLDRDVYLDGAELALEYVLEGLWGGIQGDVTDKHGVVWVQGWLLDDWGLGGDNFNVFSGHYFKYV